MEFTVEGRKTPLEEVRRKMLNDQREFLRADSDDFISSMCEDDLQACLIKLNEYSSSDQRQDMVKKLKKLQRTRHLMVWLDNSTVANHGHRVCLATCLYDPAVF